MAMRGILDLDVLCMTEIFQYLEDLWPLRYSCKQMRDFVDDHFRLLYREKWLDLRLNYIENVAIDLQNLGKYIRYLKVGEQTTEIYALMDVVATNCGNVLKGLSLSCRYYDEIEVEKFTGVFPMLEELELIGYDGEPASMEHFLLGYEYPNLTTLKVYNSFLSTESLYTFFKRKRNIKKLSCGDVDADILSLIVLNAAQIEELDISPRDNINLMSVAQLRNLKRLEIYCAYIERNILIALIKQLSISNELDILGIFNFHYLVFDDELCDALSNLTNLKKLRMKSGTFTVNDTKSIEMLGRKLSKLELLILQGVDNFPYRKFFASACQSDKFRTFYINGLHDKMVNFIEQTLKDFMDGRGQRRRCFVKGDPLCIYIEEELLDIMKELMTQDALQSIKKYGNIEILPTNYRVFD